MRDKIGEWVDISSMYTHRHSRKNLQSDLFDLTFPKP